jgi:LysM repeat protein
LKIIGFFEKTIRVMKTILLSALLPMLFAVPGASAATELEMLRDRCAAQENEIESLKRQLREFRPESAGVARTSTAEIHVVRAGDNLIKIARHYGCEPAELAKANDLKLASVIRPGQKLKVPAKSTHTVAATGATHRTHKIQQGETYSSISRKYGIPVATLIAANPKAKATALYPGLVIRLSNDAETAANPPAVERRSSTRAPSATTTPVSGPAPAAAESPPAEQTPASATEKKIRSVTIDGEMTYLDFAAKHGTDTGRLNELNGLDLTNATVLAKGSELYVPAQP